MLHEALQIIHTETQMSKPKEPKQIVRLKQSQSSIGFGSSVAIHKLRESKWFNYSENKILCSVVESGFILERRVSVDDLNTKWGIALWKEGYEKSKDIEYLSICWASIENKKIKIEMIKLTDFWLPNNSLRINNKQDKTCVPNIEEDIRKQIQLGMKNKNMKWHNCQHFAYWCRYERPGIQRVDQPSNKIKWGSLSINMGLLKMRNKNRTYTASN